MGTLTIEERHQIGNFVDFCNDCGNCDVFCPEDGGPYKIKPRFFGTLQDWQEPGAGDGFFMEQRENAVFAAGRFAAKEYRAMIDDGSVEYSGEDFSVRFQTADPEGTVEGDASSTVDMTYYHILNLIQRSIFSESEVNYVNCRLHGEK